jgi:hypothetical protein
LDRNLKTDINLLPVRGKHSPLSTMSALDFSDMPVIRLKKLPFIYNLPRMDAKFCQVPFLHLLR